MKIGVLAVQGAFIEHEKALARIGAEPVEVRLPEGLEELDGLVIPGGESTTIGKVAGEWGLLEPIRAFAESGRPLWGTCAGMILMAKEVADSMPGQPLLRLMDVAVCRNAFGRQVDSFEAELTVTALGDDPFNAVFIRAPTIETAEPQVEILARLPDGVAVAARQGKLVATAFHPELTPDLRFHRYFLEIVASP